MSQSPGWFSRDLSISECQRQPKSERECHFHTSSASTLDSSSPKGAILKGGGDTMCNILGQMCGKSEPMPSENALRRWCVSTLRALRKALCSDRPLPGLEHKLPPRPEFLNMAQICSLSHENYFQKKFRYLKHRGMEIYTNWRSEFTRRVSFHFGIFCTELSEKTTVWKLRQFWK